MTAGHTALRRSIASLRTQKNSEPFRRSLFQTLPAPQRAVPKLPEHCYYSWLFRGYQGYVGSNMAWHKPLTEGHFMSLQSSNPSSHQHLSYADGIAAMWSDFLLLVGRIMIGWIFFQSGWGKLGNIAGYAKSFPRRGLQEWMAYISVPAEFLGGLFLMLGFATRYTILVMLFFTVVASFSSHAYWSGPDAQRAGQAASFWKNVSIMGGMMALFVSTAGRFSLDSLLFRKKH